MGKYDEDVTKKIGNKELRLILEAVRVGHIDATQMQDISRKLDGWVGGNHQRRGGADETEFRNMLSDWYQNKIYEDEWDRGAVLTEIIKILKDPSLSLNPLAGVLEQCHQMTKAIVQHYVTIS